jgi:hypothetical protein
MNLAPLYHLPAVGYVTRGISFTKAGPLAGNPLGLSDNR